MAKTFNPHGERDLVFIPVGINYDRVLEDRTLLRKLDPMAAPRGVGYAMAKSAWFVVKNLGLLFAGRWHRFGLRLRKFWHSAVDARIRCSQRCRFAPAG
jgi:glycerol-3-phosphate O-acyltransferase